MLSRGGHRRASPAGRCGSGHGKDLGSSRAGPATWAGPIRATSGDNGQVLMRSV
ncbi:hypothetical protein L810_0549 [Burkholderia sp. AU4i]|nr:hypothetical protein L810_0549 [Burkholderia sp. AU4i]MDW9228508.1 hypothetical protein [Burkholderia cepacia]QOH34839.1 hypothetical protein C7S14_5621 [Burkholderia cepacia]